MAEHEMWGWIATYALACASGVWLGWLASRTIPRFTLAVAVLGLQLPLAVVGAGLDGAPGAVAGAGLGLLLAVVPMMVAVMWLVVASGDMVVRLRQIKAGVVPWAFTLWMVQAAAIGVWQGASALAVLHGAGIVALVWGMDRLAREDSWAQRVAIPWVLERTARVAAFIAALIIAMPIMVANGLRTGAPEWQAASRYMTDALAVGSINVVELVMLFAAIAAILALAGRDATRSQCYLISVGALMPLCVWLLAAAMLPPALADYGVWGVLFSAVCFLVVVVGVWVEGRPEAPAPADDATAPTDDSAVSGGSSA